MTDGGLSGYDDLDVRIQSGIDGTYRVRIDAANSRTGKGQFECPVNDEELTAFVERIGLVRRRGLAEDQLTTIQALGARLFDALFGDGIREVFEAAHAAALMGNRGLRITLGLSEAPELMRLPWEFLYKRPRFIAQSERTPLVRTLDVDSGRPPQRVRLPLRILGIVSHPIGSVKLDTEAERDKLETALRDLIHDGSVELLWLDRATRKDLNRRISARDDIHVLHYIGHGMYDDRTDAGVLLLEDEQGRRDDVSGQDLGAMLQDEHSLRLVVLNACEGAVSSRVDPFSGVATSLIEFDVPAVIGMQFEISDRAAIAFSESLYEGLAAGLPIDGSVSQARRAIMVTSENEFATPVLFLRTHDARLFDIVPHHSHSQGAASDSVSRLTGPSFPGEPIPVDADRPGHAPQKTRPLKAVEEAPAMREGILVQIHRDKNGTYRVVATALDSRVARGVLEVQEHLDGLADIGRVIFQGQTASLKQSNVFDKRLDAIDRKMRALEGAGAHLYASLFTGSVGKLLSDACELDSSGRSPRITLDLSGAPELMRLPWELLYRRPLFMALGAGVVRTAGIPPRRPPSPVQQPLRVLGILSSPREFTPIDTEAERASIEASLQPLIADGLAELTWLERATLGELNRSLAESPETHVLHFSGHASFEEKNDRGVLVFEGADGYALPVTAQQFGALVQHVRFVVLNAVDTAKTSRFGTVAGIAPILFEFGVPAVVGMQFEITDTAAIEFSRGLYTGIGQGLPIDEAVLVARRAIFAEKPSEFATPVLYLHGDAARLVNLRPLSPA